MEYEILFNWLVLNNNCCGILIVTLPYRFTVNYKVFYIKKLCTVILKTFLCECILNSFLQLICLAIVSKNISNQVIA